MKIAFLNPSGVLGGAETALLNIISSLREAQPHWELHLIASADGLLIERARSLGVTTTVLPLPKSLASLGDASAGGPAGRKHKKRELLRHLLKATPALRTYTNNLRRTLAKISPDVVHTNGLKMHVLGALTKPGRSSVVWHVHDYVCARPLIAPLMRLLAGRCSLALTNSQSVAADLQTACGRRLTVRTVYNGIDTKVFSPHGTRLDLDTLSGLPRAGSQTVRVGMLATLARWKGHETFLRAFSYLPAELPLRGYLIGGALYQTEGSQYSIGELRQMAHELNITDRFGFTGFVDNAATAMRSLDVVVHASTEPEPFGMVIVEGMACGRAVLASHGGGALELVDENINALTHPPADAIALARCLEQLVTNSELRSRLGVAGRTTAEARFDRSRLAKELVPIYQRLVARLSDDSELMVADHDQIAPAIAAGS